MNWMPNNSTRVYSVHFIDGVHSDEPEDENFAPTIFSYKEKQLSVRDAAREARAVSRHALKEKIASEKNANEVEKTCKNFSLFAHASYCSPSDNLTTDSNMPTTLTAGSGFSFADDIEVPFTVPTVDTGIQCEPDPLMMENIQLKEENKKLREELQNHKWGVHRIKDDDVATRFYTGLPSFAVFLWWFNYLSSKSRRMSFWRGKGHATPSRSRMGRSSLQPIDQLLSVLMRLRLGLFVQDVANRFCISVFFSFSMIFSLMYKELESLNVFPTRESVNRTMPSSFKAKYPSTRIIIDCTEIFLQRSTSLIAQSLTFSNYKHNNTLKFLVGITPSGVISFVSEAWGGRVSDRKITEESGLLDLLEPNDSVMADKGFTINDAC